VKDETKKVAEKPKRTSSVKKEKINDSPEEENLKPKKPTIREVEKNIDNIDETLSKKKSQDKTIDSGSSLNVKTSKPYAKDEENENLNIKYVEEDVVMEETPSAQKPKKLQ